MQIDIGIAEADRKGIADGFAVDLIVERVRALGH